MNITDLKKSFHQCYGKKPRIFRAPGRVNLIGEHTDYNEGFVLPMAIDQSTFVAAAARSDRLLQIRSLNLKESGKLNLDQLGAGRNNSWLDYIEGVAASLTNLGLKLTGADITIASDIPIGSGLSSSAALEIAIGLSLISLSGI
jgi:galactokinase